MTDEVPSTMRAAQFDAYGSPAGIVVRQVPTPAPSPGQVLVRVHATSVNGGELLLVAGAVRALSGSRFPKGLGMDFAGTVAGLGEGVEDLRVGDRIWGILPSIPTWRSQTSGAAADYAVVARPHAHVVPDGIPFPEAAVLPVVGPTALRAVVVAAGVKAGERVLVRGAAGGVGSIMVQLAHAAGAHVTALAGARTIDFVTGLGAERALDHRVTDLDDLPLFDVILDAVGSDLGAYRRHLAPGGRMVAVALDPALPGLLSIVTSWVRGGRRIRFSRQYPGRAEYDALAAVVAAGRARPVIDQRYRLEDVAAAYRAAQAGGTRGKHLIEVVPGPGAR